MIGILFFIAAGVWLYAAIMISIKIPFWLGLNIRLHTRTSLLSIPFILAIPFADEIVGQWQFNRICERDAKVVLSRDWKRVQRSSDSNTRIVPVSMNAIIPIRVQSGEYVDLDSGEIFLSYKSFHTKGGILRRHLFGLGQSNSCWPVDQESIFKLINIDKLIKQGRDK